MSSYRRPPGRSRWSSLPARCSSLPACPMLHPEYWAARPRGPAARPSCYRPEERAPMPDRYAAYPSLELERPADGVLRVVMSAPGRLNAAGHQMHRDLAGIWTEIDRDPEVRAVVVRGAGEVFSAGGDLDLVADMADDFEVRLRVLREARDLVYNLLNCSKPVVSAMAGPGVGGGGGADRAGVALRRRRRAPPGRPGGGGPAGRRVPERHPLDQVRPQQLAAPGRADLRHLAGPGVPGLRRARRARGGGVVPGETPAQLQRPGLIRPTS